MPLRERGNGESPRLAKLETPSGGRTNGHAVKEAVQIDVEQLGAVPAPDRLIATVNRDDEPPLRAGKSWDGHLGATGFVRDVGDRQPVR